MPEFPVWKQGDIYYLILFFNSASSVVRKFLMKILFIGDIVGRGGRQAVDELLPRIKEERGIDFSLANGENAAGGTGITPKIMNRLFSDGIDIITSGNHLWDKKEIIPVMDKEKRLLRPANYPPGVPGFGSTVAETDSGLKIGIINLSGRVFMPALDCPFRTAEREIKKLRKKLNLLRKRLKKDFMLNF